FGALYFAEGAPIGYLWVAVATRMRAADLPTESIGRFLALIALPWAFKFLWAPAVDALRTDRFSFRGWAIAAQAVMAATLVPLTWLDLVADFELVVACLLVHAAAAATQDVAIDALAIATVPDEERGRLNGAMQLGMILGRALFGGGALVAGARLGDDAPVTLALVLVLVVAATLLAVAVPAGAAPPDAPPSLRAAHRVVVRLLSSRRTWWGLAFAALAGAGFEAVGAMTGAALIDAGATEEQAGAFEVPRLAAMAIGALLGGALADRRGSARAASSLLVLLTAAILGLAGLDVAGAAPVAWLVALTAVYLAIGAFTAASYALFMHLAERRFAATQFSAWMGGTNLCESWAALTAGSLAGALGYGRTFAVLALAALPALLVVRRLRAFDRSA
ncbi:MAG: MFS transporter, partial [Planctomycetota bacterium JB042]